MVLVRPSKIMVLKPEADPTSDWNIRTLIRSFFIQACSSGLLVAFLYILCHNSGLSSEWTVKVPICNQHQSIFIIFHPHQMYFEKVVQCCAALLPLLYTFNVKFFKPQCGIMEFLLFYYRVLKCVFLLCYIILWFSWERAVDSNALLKSTSENKLIS